MIDFWALALMLVVVVAMGVLPVVLLLKVIEVSGKASDNQQSKVKSGCARVVFGTSTALYVVLGVSAAAFFTVAVIHRYVEDEDYLDLLLIYSPVVLLIWGGIKGYIRRKGVLGWMRGVPAAAATMESPELFRRFADLEQNNRQELFYLLDEVCDRYLDEDESGRNWIRGIFAKQPALQLLLIDYASMSASKLGRKKRVGRLRLDWEGHEKVAILRRGLAAVSIEDLRTDDDESFSVVCNLSTASESVGLDPVEHLELIARLSSQTTRGGEEALSMSQIFLNRLEHITWARTAVLGEVQRDEQA